MNTNAEHLVDGRGVGGQLGGPSADEERLY